MNSKITEYPLIKLLIISIAIAFMFGCEQDPIESEFDESQALAACLNETTDMSEAYNLCVEPASFKYESALKLARCVSRDRNVTDVVESALIIEACYE